MNGLIGATAVVAVGARFIPGTDQPGPVLEAAKDFVSAGNVLPVAPSSEDNAVMERTTAALAAFADVVRPLSHPRALETAFRAYFAFQDAHPDDVKKPYLYFVDYGLPSTEKRGYVFDMKSLEIVEGPFTVAHGRGSAESSTGIPTRFSNRPGSAATSLGLYLAAELYDFVGHSGGHRYSSVGLRLIGESGRFNSNARSRGVVAHGAPYVTQTRAGRSEGCPAMEQARARRLLPRLAHGGMVFLFAPDEEWMSEGRWIVASTN